MYCHGPPLPPHPTSPKLSAPPPTHLPTHPHPISAPHPPLQVQLKDCFEVQMVLIKVAMLMLMRGMTVDEVFDSYDTNRDGYWDQMEQWRMLKVRAGGGGG